VSVQRTLEQRFVTLRDVSHHIPSSNSRGPAVQALFLVPQAISYEVTFPVASRLTLQDSDLGCAVAQEQTASSTN
jgi:hypothetical protein